MLISVILKNEILASLVATRDNNIDSIDDLSNRKVNAIVLANSSQSRRLTEENRKFNKLNQINIESVGYRDIFSQKTLIKLMQGTHALVYSESRLIHIHNLDYKHTLHVSEITSRSQLWLSGFIMKKKIDKTIEMKIKRA